MFIYEHFDTKYWSLSSKLYSLKRNLVIYTISDVHTVVIQKSSKTKQRGYLIFNKTFYVYKCHNCEKFTDFGSLLRYVNSDLQKNIHLNYKNKNVYIQSDDNKKDLNLTKPFLKGDSPLKNSRKFHNLSRPPSN